MFLDYDPTDTIRTKLLSLTLVCEPRDKSCLFEPVTVRRLVAALGRFPRQPGLRLEYFRFTHGDMIALNGAGFSTELEFCTCSFPDDAVMPLVPKIKFYDSRYSIPSLVEMVQGNSDLVSLSLIGSPLIDSDSRDLMGALSVRNSLIALDLGESGITDQGARELAKFLKANRTLETLSIYHNAFGNDGASAIAEAIRMNEAMKELVFTMTGLTTDGIQAFAACIASLERVNITALDIDAGVFKDLTVAMGKSQTLTSVVLTCSEVIDDVAEDLAGALKRSDSIATVTVLANDLSSVAANHLADWVARCRFIPSLIMDPIHDHIVHAAMERNAAYRAMLALAGGRRGPLGRFRRRDGDDAVANIVLKFLL